MYSKIFMSVVVIVEFDVSNSDDRHDAPGRIRTRVSGSWKCESWGTYQLYHGCVAYCRHVYTQSTFPNRTTTTLQIPGTQAQMTTSEPPRKSNPFYGLLSIRQNMNWLPSIWGHFVRFAMFCIGTCGERLFLLAVTGTPFSPLSIQKQCPHGKNNWIASKTSYWN